MQIKGGFLQIPDRLAQFITNNLQDGNYILSLESRIARSTEKEYRGCYFSKLEFLAREVGENKKELHEIIKNEVLDLMYTEVPEMFIKENIISTTNLTLDGWLQYIERLDLWSYLEYGVVLP